jgi:hypothetical protein
VSPQIGQTVHPERTPDAALDLRLELLHQVHAERVTELGSQVGDRREVGGVGQLDRDPERDLLDGVVVQGGQITDHHGQRHRAGGHRKRQGGVLERVPGGQHGLAGMADLRALARREDDQDGAWLHSYETIQLASLAGERLVHGSVGRHAECLSMGEVTADTAALSMSKPGPCIPTWPRVWAEARASRAVS